MLPLIEKPSIGAGLSNAMNLIGTNIFKYFALALALALAPLRLQAGPLDDARSMIEQGSYPQAIDELRKIVKRTPRDASANYLLGLALVKNNEAPEAESYLKTAESRGSLEAARLLTELAFRNYDPDGTRAHYEIWEKAARKARKYPDDEMERISDAIPAMENMLQRVQNIEIVDTLHVPAADFFSYYRLSPEAGSILPGSAIRQPGATVAFMPETRNEIFWAAQSAGEQSRIFTSAILDDGTMEASKPVDLLEVGNASYPFMMTDGMTLYFAADSGPEGLGGYDIFMTRRTDDGDFMQAQNMGMPYNSPANDYLLAIDENTGLGWFASDRENLPDGKITIYIFETTPTRVNHSPDNPDIAVLAALSDISLTQKSGKDYAALLRDRLRSVPEAGSASSSASAATPRFEMDINGRLYTALSDFRSSQARQHMLRVLTDEANLRVRYSELDALREKWAAGNHGSDLRDRILKLEAECDSLERQLREARNAVAREELKK